MIATFGRRYHPQIPDEVRGSAGGPVTGPLGIEPGEGIRGDGAGPHA